MSAGRKPRAANWADVPELAGVVALLYRADWTRLSLAGRVHGRGGPVTVHVAPGRRCRLDDRELVTGCDGERVWQSFADPPAEGQIRWKRYSIPPFPELLCPAWLLIGYELEVLGPWMACERPGIRVAGTARHPDTRRVGLSAVLAGDWERAAARYERVEVVVDAELGIVLRCKRSGGAGQHGAKRTDVLEFWHLEVGAVVDEAMFEPPAGSRVRKAGGTGRQPVSNIFDVSGTVPSGLPLGAAKTAAGLAAGGLGAAIRYTPLGWLFRDEKGTDEPMPDDDPPSGPADDAAPVSEEVLYLLYRSGGGIPTFTATAHYWVEAGAILAGVPESARKTGLSGVGYLIDSLTRGPRHRHRVTKVRMAGWQKYRIEPVWPPGSPEGKRTRPSLTACDGKQYWEVREDSVRVGKPRPAPDELAYLTDTSWLLGCELSGGERVTFDGRAVFRLSVRGSFARFPLLWPGFPAVGLVDAQTGRLIRLTCYSGAKPVCRYELRDVTPVSRSGGDIVYAVPPGVPVVDADSAPDPPDPAQIAAQAATAIGEELRRQATQKLAAAKDFLGSLAKQL